MVTAWSRCARKLAHVALPAPNVRFSVETGGAPHRRPERTMRPLLLTPARSSPRLMTVDEFLTASVPDGKAELVRGELRVTPPPGAPHGDPARRTVTILARAHPVRWLQEAEVLDGEAVVPGFSCKVAEIFEGIARH